MKMRRESYQKQKMQHAQYKKKMTFLWLVVFESKEKRKKIEERKEELANSTREIEREMQLDTNARGRKLRQPTKPSGKKLRLKLEG